MLRKPILICNVQVQLIIEFGCKRVNILSYNWMTIDNYRIPDLGEGASSMFKAAMFLYSSSASVVLPELSK
jgi:hypothetical protein